MKKTFKLAALSLLCVGCAAIGASCGEQKETYTVVYVTGEKGYNVRNGVYTVGESFTLANGIVNEDEYRGWYFTDWYYDEACTQKVSGRNIDLSYANEKTLTFYAGWSDEYTVYLDTRTDQILDNVPCHAYDKINTSEFATPEAYEVGGEEYEFLYWVNSSNGQRVSDTLTIRGDVYLYACYDTGVNENYRLTADGYVPLNTAANSLLFDYTLKDGEVYSFDMTLPEVPSAFATDSGVIISAGSFNSVSKTFDNYMLMFVGGYTTGFGTLMFYATCTTEITTTTEVETTTPAEEEGDAPVVETNTETVTETSTALLKLASFSPESAELIGTAYYEKLMAYKQNGGKCTFTYTIRREGENTWHVGVDGVEYVSVTLTDTDETKAGTPEIKTADGVTTKTTITKRTKKTWKVGKDANGEAKDLVGLRAKTKNLVYSNLEIYTASPTVYFDAGKGSVSTSKIDCEYNKAIGQLPTPTRTGYDFGYWYYYKDGEKVQLTEDSKIDTSLWQVHAKAYWTKTPVVEYTVNFDTGIEGYTVDSLKGWTEGNELETPTLIRPFFTFSGKWYYDKACTQVVDPTDVDLTIANPVDNAFTLYAEYEKSDELFSSSEWLYTNGRYMGTGKTLVNTESLLGEGVLLEAGKTYTVDVTLPYYKLKTTDKDEDLLVYSKSYVIFGATGLDTTSEYYQILIFGNDDANASLHGTIQLWRDTTTNLASRNRGTEQLQATGYADKYAEYMKGNSKLSFKLGVVVNENSFLITIDGKTLLTWNGTLAGKYVGFGSVTSYSVTFNNVQIFDTVNENGFKGEGTLTSPYQLSSEDDLFNFATKIGEGNSFAGKYFALTKDIALTKDWTPIVAGFAGTLDGKNYTISNLNIANWTVKNAGLFASLTAGTVQNLNLNVNIVSTADTIGGIAGLVSGTVVIQNCEVRGSISGGSDLGGIVGYANTEDLQIIGCKNYATITSNKNGNSFAGGILGSSAGSTYTETSKVVIKVVIQNCENHGAITGGNFLGGIAGLIRVGEDSAVANCKNFADITSTVKDSICKQVGGLIGDCRVKVTGSYCSEDVTITTNGTSKKASAWAQVGSTTAGLPGWFTGVITTVPSDMTDADLLAGCGLCNAQGTAIDTAN